MAEKTIEQLKAELEKAKADAKDAKSETEAAKAEAEAAKAALSEKEPENAINGNAVDYNRKVKYTPPIVPGILEDDLIVIHKGFPYQLPRGVKAEIPLKVYNVIIRSDAQRLQASKYASEQREIYMKAEKALS